MIVKTKLFLFITRAGRNAVVVLARITGARPACQGPLAAGGTGQTVTRRSLTGRASLGAGWGILIINKLKILPAQVATLLSNYPVLQGHAPLVKVL